MTGLFGTLPIAVSLDRQIAGAKREAAMRRGVYADRVAAGKMTKAKADEEIAVMDAIVGTLEGLRDGKRSVL